MTKPKGADRWRPLWAPLLVPLILAAGCGGSDPASTCVPSGAKFTSQGSIGPNGSGIFRAGAIPTTQGNTPISGTVVVGNISNSSVTPTNSPAPSGVLLEQQSHAAPVQGGSGGNDTVENLIGFATTDSNGHFTFCVGPSGNYEIVAIAAANTAPSSSPSAATITAGVAAGRTNLMIPLVAASNSTLAGMVTTENNSSPPGAGDDFAIVAMQPFGPSTGPNAGGQVQALLSFFQPFGTTNSSNSGSTGCPGSCPANTNCACYGLQVPDSNPVIGGPSTDGTGYSAPSSSPVTYSLDAQANLKGTATSACSPSEIATTSFTVTSGNNTAPTVSFTNCN